jgi:hypothetical protein
MLWTSMHRDVVIGGLLAGLALTLGAILTRARNEAG